MFATTEHLCSQRSATKSPKPNFNEVKEESRKEKGERRNIVQTSENKACLCFYNECSRTSTKLKEKQRSLVATLCRDDKHTIIFALSSFIFPLSSVLCYLLASPKLLSLGIVKVNIFSALAYSQLSLYSVLCYLLFLPYRLLICFTFITLTCVGQIDALPFGFTTPFTDVPHIAFKVRFVFILSI